MPDPSIESRSDAQLVAAAAGGERLAFDALYHRHKEWAYRLAWRFTQDPTDAQDVVQEVFIYLARKIPTLRLTSGLTTLLYPAIKHTAIGLRRKRRRMVRVAEDAPEIPAPPLPVDADATRIELAEVLAGLSEAHREVLLMRFVDDLQLEEIAEALAIPLGTAKSRLHHALGALRDNPRFRKEFEA